MGRLVLSFAGLVLIAASFADAQTTTLDGVDALARGDYPRAAQILKPIAESWPPRDHVAEFFMATLYENGRGVAADPIRACALYIRASLDTTGPLSSPADELMQALRGSLSDADFQRCVLLVNVGFDHDFRPVSFMLEQGHWISIDLDGATTTYDGKEKRIELGLAASGAVFLPVEHTELTFGPSQSTRRHFIEFFFWTPRAPGRTWTLMWHVVEVVRQDLVPITITELVTISGERPPNGSSFDVRGIAGLRVNENGYAEWAVLSGPNERTGLIETEVERQEIREQARARQAVESRVDWRRVRDVKRAPALTYSDADGCGQVWVYGWSDDRTEAITIRADKDLLGLSATPKTFDLASQLAGLDVQVHVYQWPVRSWPFCTDVQMQTGPEETWRAIRGTVTIELTPPVVRTGNQSAYRATIRIVGMEVVSTTGIRVAQPQPLTFTPIVGWISG